MIYCMFNAVALDTLTDVFIQKVSKDDMPKRNLTNYKLSQADGQAQTAAFFDSQVIHVSGHIIAADRNTFDQDRNTLMQYLTPEDANLDIIVGNNVVRYKATAESVIFSDVGGGWGNFDIKFTCSTPVGIDPNLKILLATTVITAATSTQNLATIGGSYKTFPFITIYINSGTGLTSQKEVRITNPATSEAISITRNWAAGERLEIDLYNRTVQVNRANVDFTGALPYWNIGAGGTIKYDDTFTTRNISLTVQTYARYL